MGVGRLLFVLVMPDCGWRRPRLESRAGEKLAYFANHCGGLRVQLEDSRVENTIRAIALGRNTSLFAGHDEGGRCVSGAKGCCCRGVPNGQALCQPRKNASIQRDQPAAHAANDPEPAQRKTPLAEYREAISGPGPMLQGPALSAKVCFSSNIHHLAFRRGRRRLESASGSLMRAGTFPYWVSVGNSGAPSTTNSVSSARIRFAPTSSSAAVLRASM